MGGGSMLLAFSDVEPLLPSDVSAVAVMIYIEDVTAMALAEAPCLSGPLEPHVAAAVKSILRQAVLRWHRSGEGGVSSVQETAGPFSQTVSYSSSGGGRLYPSELTALRRLCPGGTGGRKAFSVRPRLA